ncbi:phosphatidate cytidylyltransferase [Cognatazoarcus halotolerans]|uniref:phosphatidate cytidylyltransferase n=1 Tax=Cognatazoarcus halotolerans TaxID=2686016 RepID=UPI001359632F|nr:phosphatidate cytidylyltransferase [Cognatazoarcus halotolerans]MCB1898116.1 phosphatidate cytidylyltransferase [Rhodocyclaceae bacterium]MCP5309000.1 phosphatidate cytidylyltransferase [Zoogloeaceae bacterium]
MLKTRIITAVVLVTFFAGLLFFASPFQWMLFAAAVAAIGAWEWGALIRAATAFRYAYAFGIALIVLFLAPSGLSGLGEVVARTSFVVSGSFWLLVVPFWLRNRWRFDSVLVGAGVGVILLVPTALALILLRQSGAWILLAVMAAVWVADIGAFFVGRRFGRIKLAPMISPGKSREGAYGAIMAVWIYGALVLVMGFRVALGPVEWLAFLAVLAVLTVVSIMGDLFESLAKRQAGVKDSGTILPGHGGVLDRIDSLTSALPFSALLLAASVPFH